MSPSFTPSLIPFQPHWPILLFHENAKHFPIPRPLHLPHLSLFRILIPHRCLACSLASFRALFKDHFFQRSFMVTLYKRAAPLSIHSLGCENQNCLQTLPNVPWGQKSHPDENHEFKGRGTNTGQLYPMCQMPYVVLYMTFSKSSR